MSEKNANSPGDLLAVGRILRPHGIRGALVVESLTDWPGRFVPGAKMLLEKGPGDHTEVTLLSAAPHGGRFLVSLEGLEDRDAAGELRGLFLEVPACEAAPLAEGEFWAHELADMALVDAGGRELGRVREVMCRQAQDLIVASTAEGAEFSVPLVSEFVKEIDMESRTITVKLPEGMGP
ncbi:MAG TPA: ribosome maturation factor RimM [Candidatus Anoxymicrobiaceae bacterium]